MANNGNAAGGVTPGLEETLTARISLVEARVTGIEQTLAAKIPGFEQVGTRVTELSGAFLQANGRLAALEAGLEALQAAAPAPAEQRLAAVEQALALLAERVTALAATRGRSGLSGRLASIEEKLNALLPPTTPGGTE